MVKKMLGLSCLLALVAPFAGLADLLPAYAYIQRGLIAQWDGIDNAGTGAHVADTNAWADLKGNCAPFSGTALSFVDGNCAWLKSTSLKTTCSALPTVYAAVTLEAHAYASQFTSHGGTDGIIGCGQGCSIFWQGGTTKFGISYVHDSTLKQYFQGTNAKITPSADIYKTNTLTLAQHDYAREIYISGVSASFANNNNQWSGSPCATIGQGVTFGSGNAGTYWRAYSLRLYGVALSAKEVAYNAAIDQVRFHGKTLAEALPATMPDGYRLNQAQDGIEVRIVCTTPAADGTLSANGGAAVATNECWVTLGTEMTIVFQPAAGKGFGYWTDAPSHATQPTEGTLVFTAHGPEQFTASAKVVSTTPILSLDSVSGIGTATATLNYNVVSAGDRAETVTLYACYGQHPDRLAYTNVADGVIGKGSMIISGLIQGRTYYVKLLADGNGRVSASEMLSFAALSGNYEPSYDARQPLVTSCNITRMPTAFRLRGYVTAPAGTLMTLFYGTTDDVSAMTAFPLPAADFADGVYRIDMRNLAAETKYYFVLRSENGAFVDDYPLQDVTTLAAETRDMGKNGYVHFNGSSYLQAQHLVGNVETGPFSVSVWVRNPRGAVTTLKGRTDSWEYAGTIVGNGAYGQSPGICISAAPEGFTDVASFVANPKFALNVDVRDSNGKQVEVSIPSSYGIWHDDTWHHVVGTYDPLSKTLTVYLDGALFDSKKLSTMSAVSASGYTFALGSFYGGVSTRFLNGDVAEVSVWRKVLSAWDVRKLRREALAGTEEGLALYWPLEGATKLVDFCEGPDPANLTQGGTVTSYVENGPVIRKQAFLIFIR